MSARSSSAAIESGFSSALELMNSRFHGQTRATGYRVSARS
jgi:hypothetical protein